MRIAVLGVLLAGLSGEAAAAGELRAVVGLTSYGYTVQVSVNGKQIPLFKGGSSEVVQVFAADHPQKERTVARFHSVYCLKPGRNSIKVEYKEVDASLAVLPMTLYMNSREYSSSVFEFTLQKATSGSFETQFELYDTMPAAHTTQRIVRSPQ
ncbi:MAG TPA: hypothetical protein VET51_05565 [Burkholderiales bacterium]|nr:hypothetical protein [Burkholderiales bacterium]